jgi:hypothetical protein
MVSQFSAARRRALSRDYVYVVNADPAVRADLAERGADAAR